MIPLSMYGFIGFLFVEILEIHRVLNIHRKCWNVYFAIRLNETFDKLEEKQDVSTYALKCREVILCISYVKVIRYEMIEHKTRYIS